MLILLPVPMPETRQQPANGLEVAQAEQQKRHYAAAEKAPCVTRLHLERLTVGNEYRYSEHRSRKKSSDGYAV